MTRTVKEYISKKIHDAAIPHQIELSEAIEATKALVPSDSKLIGEIRKSKEYKAFKDAIKRIASEAGVRVYYKYGDMDDCLDRLAFRSPDVQKATEKYNKFRDAVDDAVMEAQVAVELAKDKAAVEDAIANAIAAISKAK